MNLLERYLQEVGKHLPASGREDTLAELRANLLSEIEGREEEAGRPLTEAEMEAVLEAHGMPMLVAARYRPQQSLIGPGLFPFYWFTLRKSFPLVLLAYTAVTVLRLIMEGRAANIQSALFGLPGVLLTFWAVMTLGFAVFEYAQGRYISKVCMPKWSARQLPQLETKEKKTPSYAHGVADLIVSVLVVAWLLAVPTHPFFIIGPGAKLVHEVPFGLTPEWHIFYWQIIGLLIAMLPLKVMMLVPSMAKWRKGLDVAVHVMGILILVIMVQVRSYFVPAAALTMESVKTLAGINAGISFGFKVALAISVLKLLWDLWQMMSGARQTRAGCATVF